MDWEWSDPAVGVTLVDDPRAIWIENEGKAVPTEVEGKAVWDE